MKVMSRNSLNLIEGDLKNKPLNDLYTRMILNNLKSWEDVSLKWSNWDFTFYKNDENVFGVYHNSEWIKFIENPMSQKEMENILNPIISHSDDFESKISDDLLIRLRNMLFEVNEKNQWEIFTVNHLLKNVSLDNILSTLEFKKQLLNETENKISQWIVWYLENAVNILNELILQYPEKSVIRKKIQEKLNYLESYRKTFSDWKFIEWIKNNISDLENFLDILENYGEQWELASQIKDLRNKKAQENFTGQIEWFFNKIYVWDAFAILYAQFGDQYWVPWSVDKWTKALAELNWWDNWDAAINRLWSKQESLMDEKLSFEQKKEVFKNANQEYLNSVWFILWTGHNKLPNDVEYYKKIHDTIEVENFIWMPCSDIYPAILQKTILPTYLQDLYTESCELLWEKSLDKSIDKYIEEMQNPSWFAKLTSKFKNNDNKIESLKNISEKIKLLNKKFDSLDRQIRDFWENNKEALMKMALEFCVIEEFVNIDNTDTYPPYMMSEQDKRLNFMRKN